MEPVAFKSHDNVNAVFYDAGNKTLRVMFPRGSYEYSNVSPELVEEIKGSENVSTTLVQLRDKNLYPVTRLS